jgi:hypothetical protein
LANTPSTMKKICQGCRMQFILCSMVQQKSFAMLPRSTGVRCGPRRRSEF